MKQAEGSSPLQGTFPSILSKTQSGTLFSKENLLLSLNPSSNFPSSQTDFSEVLKNPKIFKKNLRNFYKSIDFDKSKSESAMNQIEYLFDLFRCVHDKGG